MIERGILMTAENVRAMKDGRKLESRRTTAHGLKEINQNPDAWTLIGVDAEAGTATFQYEDEYDPFSPVTVKSRYGGVGTLLWVRETWRCTDEWIPSDDFREVNLTYLADGADLTVTGDPVWIERNYRDIADSMDSKIRPSIFMPRWASRITAVRKVFRFERLHDICEADAKAEGVSCCLWYCPTPDESTHVNLSKDAIDPVHPSHGKADGVSFRNGFATLWDRVNGPGSWARNDWVEVVGWDQAEVRA